jgi:hypothetical protein
MQSLAWAPQRQRARPTKRINSNRKRLRVDVK